MGIVWLPIGLAIGNPDFLSNNSVQFDAIQPSFIGTQREFGSDEFSQLEAVSGPICEAKQLAFSCTNWHAN